MLQFQKKGNSAYRNVEDAYQYVTDPNERRRLALAEVDKAPFAWYHIRLIVVTGVGFFTDAYSLFAVNLAVTMIGIVYWQNSNGGVISRSADTAIKVSTSAGTVIGQVVFGYLADLLGRKRMYGVELLMIIMATMCQALCAPSPSMSFVGILCFWRVIMGIGIGGDYPLSAIVTAEFASTKRRGAMIAAVFAMQGIGQAVASLMALIVTQAFRSRLEPAKSVNQCGAECLHAVDIMWRILLAFGGIPGWFALYYRLTIPETPRYTFDVLHDIEKATADTQMYRSGKRGEGHVDRLTQARTRQEMKVYKRPPPTVLDQLKFFCKWKNGVKLIGTAGSWFFLDTAFYGLGLNTGSILGSIGFNRKDNVYDMLHNVAVGQLFLVCAGAIPGYWVTVATIDRLGRRIIQIGGFVILTVLFAVIGFKYDDLSQNGLLALYILSQFFFNFGPNATTFISPAECFPTRVRCTAHGLSAGAGKIGAIFAQVFIGPLRNRGAPNGSNSSPWLDHVMEIYALFMFCGLLTSFLVPETKQKTLEELNGEKEEDLTYELQFRSNFFRLPSRPRFPQRAWRFGKIGSLRKPTPEITEITDPDVQNEHLRQMRMARESFYMH